MKTSFPTKIRAAARAHRLPARISGALTLLALAAACAPLPQETGYQPYGFRPAAAYYPQQPSSGYYYQPDDETDRVVPAPAPAPAAAPPETKSAELQAQPAPATPTPAPTAPPSDPSNRSSTCGYWRLGCGILWQ